MPSWRRLPGTDPVHKVTICRGSRALGYTMVLPDEDKYSQTRSEMLDKLAHMLGGRAAEEMVFHDPTTGAGNDIEKATALARAMVTQYGDRAAGRHQAGGSPTPNRSWAATSGTAATTPRTSRLSSAAETKKLLATAHQEAFDILVENRDVLDALVLALVDKETLDKEEVAQVFEPLRRRPARPAWTGSPDRIPSAIPPVEIPQEIRDRVAANGTPKVEAAAVLTPPGPGGDVHGGPTVDPTLLPPPTPPAPPASS
ncbi:MAG: hypothetical protein R2734_03855 [Nocardioides sp.]